MKLEYRWPIGVLVVVALAVALMLIAPVGQRSLAAGDTIYVDADAGGASNGTSWVDAFTDLQSALEVAEAGQDIWLAEGTYTPTLESWPGDPRSASFQMLNGVAIYGGFSGTESSLDERDWEAHETILSGDLGGNDGPDFANNEENSYHVFYHPDGTGLDATAILDGFTITGGNADGGYRHSDGSGMYNMSSSPTLANCNFVGNSASGSGGGMYNRSSSPTLGNCIFSGNSASNSGGGMYNWDSSSPALADCTFSGNSAIFGGGVGNDLHSSPTLTNCTLSGNSALHGGGGGMYNWDSSSPVLTKCTFSGNSAGYGGGMFNGLSSPAMTDCTFLGNSGTSFTGGGMENYDSSPTLANCTFLGNSADWRGGGMYNSLSSPVLTNCTFSGNSATAFGSGGMYNSSSSPVVTNCIFWGDTAGGFPGEIDSIGGQPTITYSDIQGGYEGAGNIDADPLFAGPGSGDYHLSPGSPCIDAGANDAPTLPNSDFEGDPRVMDGNGDTTGVVDMGSDEVLAKIIYVDQDASGANNGTSWEDAYTNLQLALEEAIGGNHIWTAEGIYIPTEELFPGDPRSAAFQLKNGIAIYGGFDPTVGDAGWEDRDWASNVTVLSGDIGTIGDASDNSYHVLHHPPELALDGTAVLDGFTISAGNADGDRPNDAGGGMLNRASSPALTNCTFSGNSASDSGGGMFNGSGSSPSVTGCTFVGNWAGSGGGISNDDSSPVVANCTYSDNSADSGGGMFNNSSSPTLTNCTFSGNSADSGGGMHNGDNSSPAVTNCTFSGNVASHGGGIFNNSSSPAVTGSTLSNNSADSGGGMYNGDNSSPVVTDSAFSGNSGSGMYNSSSSPAVTDCTFSGNSSSGMYNGDNSSPAVTNCTFSGNLGSGMHTTSSSPAVTNCTFSGNSGSGMDNSSSSPVVTNCILWGDTAGGLPSEISNVDSVPVVTYSDIQGGYDGAGNIDLDPLFVGPGSGDYHLGPGSPCVDAGTNDAPTLANSDFESDPRVLDGDADGMAVVDMGVDEVWGPPLDVIYVDQDAAGYNNGTSWEDALTDLQVALAWAVEGVEIWVAEGTYLPTYLSSPGDSRSATFQLKDGVALYGGFDPTVGDAGWEDRDWVNNVTVLSGDLGTKGDRGDNSYHVFYHPGLLALDGTAMLDGFTVSDGYANGHRQHNHGSGMYNSGSSPAVANCTFSDNSAILNGGAMYNSESSPALTHCTFSGNSAIFGAGMYNASSSPALSSCRFSGNSAQNGGAMFNMSSSPALTNCTFSDNVTTNSGGGLYNSYSSPTLTNCTFSGNSGGIYNSYSSSPVLANCILWDDSAQELYNYDVDSIPVVTYSDVQGGYDGTGNIDEDPWFVDAASGDFHLGLDSPCIDAGNNDAPDLPVFDFEGDDRVLDGDGNVTAIVDMGVDEVSVDWPYFYVYLPLALRGY